MSYLITATLLNSRDYFLSNIDNEKAESDFMSTLKREPIPDNEYMKAGRDYFEEAVKRYSQFEQDDPCFSDDYNLCVKEVAAIVKGGTWGMKDKRTISVDGVDFLLYGRFDVIKRECIYDIKFKCSTYEHGDFKDSNQHVIYMALLPGCEKFEYVISNGHSVFTETYYRNDGPDIHLIVSSFWSWLQAYPKYRDIFIQKWESF